ncbi:hypothetical protein HFN_1022 [Helicobacter fennelliae MRY12-0050]|uniref:Uncharacterized protein n=1 Tax=Helicobacter fennelliae MRY12-0050 TaxID=1325130 RepID=T1DWX0_9HELI|nr:hypothetical protein HFN_1022 [Helicobacter fennelliae MRY12-0050]
MDSLDNLKYFGGFFFFGIFLATLAQNNKMLESRIYFHRF